MCSKGLAHPFDFDPILERLQSEGHSIKDGLSEESFIQCFVLCVQEGRNDVLWNLLKSMGYSMDFDFQFEIPAILLKADQTIEFSNEARQFLTNVKSPRFLPFRFSAAFST